MAIYAERNFSPRLVYLKDRVKDRDVLVYSEELGFFTNENYTRALGFSAPPITSAVGVGNGLSLIEDIDGDTLRLRNITPGPGIMITAISGNLVLSVNRDRPNVISDTDYTVIIDSDSNEPGAVFQVATVDPTSATTISVNVLPPTNFANVRFETNTSGEGMMYTDFDIVSYGYATDMIIEVSGAHVYDGIYYVKDVGVSGTEWWMSFSEVFGGDRLANIGTTYGNVEIKQASMWIPDNTGDLGPSFPVSKLYSVQVWGVDFGSLNIGDVITIEGSENGLADGTYIIHDIFVSGHDPQVKWPALVFSPTTPLPEYVTPGAVFDRNLFSNELRINVLGVKQGSGFHVTKQGDVHANNYVTTCANPVNPFELTPKTYVDTEITIAVNNLLSALNTSLTILQNRLDTLEKNVTNKALRFYLNETDF